MIVENRIPSESTPIGQIHSDELARQSAQLQSEVSSLMPLILDTVSDIVVVLNEKRRIVYANRNLYETFGTANGTVSGKRLGEVLDCIHAHESPGGCGTTTFCPTCGLAVAALSSLQGQQALEECSITQRNGSALEFRVRAQPLVLDGHRYSIFAVHDISDEKRRRALERIFYHDILNSVGLVAGYVDLLNDERVTDSAAIQGALRRVSDRLIDEIMAQRDLAEAEAYELQTHATRLNSLDLLHTLKTTYASYTDTSRIPIAIAVDAQSIDFSTDVTLLRRVIGNMLKNALEASQPGETITLCCMVSGKSVEFGVRNPGAIPAREQTHIFRRSFSTKGKNRGLGTYSMKLLTERYLRGEVGFVSNADDGTYFFARLPV